MEISKPSYINIDGQQFKITISIKDPSKLSDQSILKNINDQNWMDRFVASNQVTNIREIVNRIFALSAVGNTLEKLDTMNVPLDLDLTSHLDYSAKTKLYNANIIETSYQELQQKEQSTLDKIQTISNELLKVNPLPKQPSSPRPAVSNSNPLPASNTSTVQPLAPLPKPYLAITNSFNYEEHPTIYTGDIPKKVFQKMVARFVHLDEDLQRETLKILQSNNFEFFIDNNNHVIFSYEIPNALNNSNKKALIKPKFLKFKNSDSFPADFIKVLNTLYLEMKKQKELEELNDSQNSISFTDSACPTPSIDSSINSNPKTQINLEVPDNLEELNNVASDNLEMPDILEIPQEKPNDKKPSLGSKITVGALSAIATSVLGYGISRFLNSSAPSTEIQNQNSSTNSNAVFENVLSNFDPHY
jgi:hypothetical protein